MSTRSRIGIIRSRPEGESPVVESIYCHFDGYPEGVGQVLLDHWTTEDKVLDLIELGDLSSLGSVLGEQHDFDRHLPDYYSDPNREMLDRLAEDEAREFRLQLERESPYGKGWCCAFGRDRGEEDAGSRTHSIDEWPDYGQEAEYLFDPETGEWRVRRWAGWISIPEAIELEAEERERYEREHVTT